MKTRLAALTVSFLVALGLSGCYTEFATTSGNYGGYGSSYSSGSAGADTSQYGYGPTYYDSTGSPAVNPNYQSNDYGYGTYGMGGYGYGNAWPAYGYGYYGSPYMNNPLWSYSMFYPSAAWWPMDSWYLGFGMSSWYGGPFSYGGLAGWGNWPSYYYPYLGGYYPNNPYYNVYSPYSPYSLNPWYTPYTNAQPNPRVRTSGDTRFGRTSYGGGDVIPPAAIGGANTGTANASTGAAGSVGTTYGPRERLGGSGTPASTGTVNTTNAPRVRGQAPVYTPTQQNSTPNPQHRVRERIPTYAPPQQVSPTPNSPQSNPQPRVREQAPNNTPRQQPNQNSTPQSNPQPRVREQAPSYSPPPQQPAPSYNPPPQYNPPPSSPPAQAPSPRIRHGYVSYNGGYQQPRPEVRPRTYRVMRVTRVLSQRPAYAMPAQQVARYEAPRFQQGAPSYGYRAVPQPEMRTSVSSARVSSPGAAGGGRTRH